MGDKQVYVDVCVVCALPEEAEAVIKIFSHYAGQSFESMFNPRTRREYRSVVLHNRKREELRIHVSWPPNYGPVEMGLHLRPLLEEFRPRFILMAGICAGDPHRVKLGDLVVADRAYLYENGKVILDEEGKQVHLHDTETWHADKETLQFARMFRAWEELVTALPRPLSRRQQKEWLLNRLLMEETMCVDHIPFEELKRDAPDWRKLVKDLQYGDLPFLAQERVLRDREGVRELRYRDEPFPFQDPLQARCLITPMASGSAVRADEPFRDIQVPVRGTVAIDMEGAVFYRVAAEFPGTYALLVKGICDYADSEKDDTYHTYAAEASASYALAFIQEYVNGARMSQFRAEAQQKGADERAIHVRRDGTSSEVVHTTPLNRYSEEQHTMASKDFFISYSSADRRWAEWVAGQLEARGFSTILQVWDFRPGFNYIQEMQVAATVAQRTILILSPDYLGELEQHPEWSAAFLRSMQGQKGALIPICVRNCTLTGLLAPILPIDLNGLDAEEIARRKLLEGLQLERVRPAEPPFPGIIAPQSISE